jgi:hypothetical protein
MMSVQELAIEKKMALLPQDIYDFIVNPGEEYFNASPAVELSLDQKRLIKYDIKQVYTGDLSVADFVAMAKTKLGLPEDEFKKFAADFIGYRFLPIDDHMKGQASQSLIAMGVSPSNYNVKMIVVRAAKPLDLVTEFLHEHPVNVPAHLEQRLREILESRVRGVRKDADTVNRLVHAEKIGGVELPQAEAEALVEALAAKVASVSISPDNEPEPVVVVPPAPVMASEDAENEPKITVIPTVAAAPRVMTTTAVAPVASSKSGHGVMPEDEHEANIIRETVLPNVVSSALFDMEEEIKKCVSAVTDATSTPLSVPLEERYKTVIASRLKGIRDAAETRDILVRETAKGGLGFSDVDADKTMVLVENEMKLIVNKKEAALKNEKTDFVKNAVNATFAKDESRKKGELEELDRMYSSLTGKVSKTPVPATPSPVPSAPVAPPPKASAPVVPPAPFRIPTPSAPPVAAAIASAPPSVLPKAPAPLPPVPAVQRPSIVPAPAVPVIAAAPAPVIPPPRPPAPTPLPPVVPMPTPRPAAPVMPSPPIAPPRMAAPSPKMQDVRPLSSSQPAARLTGPVQELAIITLADFRRLSADPVEACRKISDKLDVLEESAYTQRIAGIKAWQGSEVYKRYLEVINAAFSGGKQIAAAIADSQAAGRETPTEREVRAIMELNRQLKA